MKEAIIDSIANPAQLENLYRENKSAFKKEFNLLYPQFKESPIAQVWYERLNFQEAGISFGSSKELIFVLAASFLAGLIAKIPDLISIDSEFFYSRNIAFIVFPLLSAFFAWKQQISPKKAAVISGIFLLSLIYINILPKDYRSDTLVLACIHLPLFLWATLGYSFIGGDLKNYPKRLDFLKYNGDLVVMTTLILIAGGILTGITLGLFSLIDIKIEEFYFRYIVIWGAAASPIVGTFLVQTNPQLVNKVSPVIAKVFTPLVLITLVVYLLAVIYTGKDPYNDRDFLLLFNILLIGVMAIILFSIAESSQGSSHKINNIMLFVLSAITIVVNGIALSAILFRISEWGITPNRMAVLGSNILILSNLLMVAFRLFKVVRKSDEIENIEKSIALFLPIYTLWTALVCFLFPLLFGFR